MPGDHDGDGGAGVAVFRPSIGRWYDRAVPEPGPDRGANTSYGYTGGNPVNRIDPLGLNWLSDAASDVGDFIASNRYMIIDAGIGIAAVAGCATVVGCLVVVGTGAAAHWGSDQFIDDGRDLSIAEIGFSTTFSATAGRLCGMMFAQGCTMHAAGPAASALPQLLKSSASSFSMRQLAGLFAVDMFVLKSGLQEALFGDDC